MQGQSGSIPVLLRTNYSYGYKPRGQDSQFVLTLASEDGGFFDRVRNVAGKEIILSKVSSHYCSSTYRKLHNFDLLCLCKKEDHVDSVSFLIRGQLFHRQFILSDNRSSKNLSANCVSSACAYLPEFICSNLKWKWPYKLDNRQVIDNTICLCRNCCWLSLSSWVGY